MQFRSLVPGLRAHGRLVLAPFTFCLVACTGALGPSGTDEPDDDDSRPEQPLRPGDADDPDDVLPPFAPGPAAMRQLTSDEYVNSLGDLLGIPVPADASLQPDSLVARYAAVGAASTTLSEAGVEKAESLSLSLVAQVFRDPARRQRLVGCEPAKDGCARAFIESFGRRAWRRPLEPEQVERYVGVADQIGKLLGDAWEGLAMATAGLLQSPFFLHRIELGKPHPENPDLVVYDDWELAARLSFLLWGSTPDDELLEQAERGLLTDPDNMQAQTRRLLASPRAPRATAKFFRELLGVDGPVLQKDRQAFPQATPTLWRSMREEAERLLIDAAFEPGGDFREAFTTRRGYVDGELAPIYGLTSSARGDLEAITHPDDGPRIGVLTTAAFLAQHGIPERGSPVHRGLFIRETLLCGHIPSPPENVDLTLEPSTTARTTRQRLEPHASDPSCSACHSQMDEIGFAFESFDGLGVHRLTENGEPVETHGSLDGQPFADVHGLVDLLLAHPAFDRCLVVQLYRHGTARVEGLGDESAIASLVAAFRAGGHNWHALLDAFTTDAAFRLAGKPQ